MTIYINDDPEPVEIDDILFQRMKDTAQNRGISLDEMFTEVLELAFKRSFKTVKEYSEMLEDEHDLPFDQIIFITDDDGKPIVVQVPYGMWNGNDEKKA